VWEAVLVPHAGCKSLNALEPVRSWDYAAVEEYGSRREDQVVRLGCHKGQQAVAMVEEWQEYGGFEDEEGRRDRGHD
jgi:hypothetical protein